MNKNMEEKNSYQQQTFSKSNNTSEIRFSTKKSVKNEHFADMSASILFPLPG